MKARTIATAPAITTAMGMGTAVGATALNAGAAGHPAKASCYRVTVRGHAPHALYHIHGCAPTPRYAPTANHVAHDLTPLVLPEGVHIGRRFQENGKVCTFVWAGDGDTSAIVCYPVGKPAGHGTASTS